MDRIILVKNGSRVYNQATGNYEGGDKTQTTVHAKVTSVSVQNAQIMYGDLRKRAIVLRNMYPINWVNWDFDYIIYDGKKYTLDNNSKYTPRLGSFYFSEV